MILLFTLIKHIFKLREVLAWTIRKDTLVLAPPGY